MRERSDRNADVTRRAPRLLHGLVVLGVLIGLGFHLASIRTAEAQGTLEWREEVALHDGAMIVLSWWVQLPGQPFHYMVGEQRLTFTHPTTRQQIVWVDSGKVGSRLNPVLLDVHGEQPYLVGVPQTGPDEDGFGCPTPPDIVFRYEGGLWRRLPFSELPPRFVNANLVGYGEKDLILESKGYLTTAAEAPPSGTSARHESLAEWLPRCTRQSRPA